MLQKFPGPSTHGESEGVDRGAISCQLAGIAVQRVEILRSPPLSHLEGVVIPANVQNESGRKVALGGQVVQ